MTVKSTFNLENELMKIESLESFLNQNQQDLAEPNLASQLQDLLDAKGLTKSDVVKESNLNTIYAYQILSGARRPSRDKLLSLCFAIKATLEETQFLLRHNEFAPLYVKNRRDSIIIYALSRGQNLIEVNNALYEHEKRIIE